MEPCIKLIGSDFELANAIEVPGRPDGAVAAAAKLLLAEIDGYPLGRSGGGTAREWGRRWFSSGGGGAYNDLDHLEITLAEHTRADEHAAILHAGLRVAREAQVSASGRLEGDGRIRVLACVSDGFASWGHHLNVMVRRRFFDDLFCRRPHLAGFLATHLVTATVFTGQGHVGPGNGRSPYNFQLSPRADWFEQFTGHETTVRRGLLNRRDEPHAGAELARQHIIFFDNVLCPVANHLQVGTTQLVLAMAEAGWADPALLLDDPLGAASEVSRDLTLRKGLPMARRGVVYTAIEVQRALAERAGEFVASGEAAGAVPGAEEIIALWLETLELLAQREMVALARRLDWALKYLLLERKRGRNGLSWRSAQLKLLDLLYSSLDPDEGLFLQMAAAGQVEAMPSPERIERFFREPPDDSRAFLRAHVLRRFGEHVADVDWDRIRFRVPNGRYWSSEATVLMPDPAAYGRSEAEPIINGAETLDDLVEALGSPAQGEESDPTTDRTKEDTHGE